MSWILHDPDEWETIVKSESYGKDPFGNPIGSFSVGQQRRDPKQVSEIKAEKRRQHEETILAEAAAIRKRRSDAP